MILNKHKGEFMCCELKALNAVSGAEHAYFCTLVIVGGAEHAQTFNFGTAADSDDDFELPFFPREYN